MVELKELVLASINGKRKSNPREYARASCAVRASSVSSPAELTHSIYGHYANLSAYYMLFSAKFNTYFILSKYFVHIEKNKLLKCPLTVRLSSLVAKND